MVELCLDGSPEVSVVDLEARRSQDSYDSDAGKDHSRGQSGQIKRVLKNKSHHPVNYSKGSFDE